MRTTLRLDADPKITIADGSIPFLTSSRGSSLATSLTAGSILASAAVGNFHAGVLRRHPKSVLSLPN
jgi:hypothetical protein